MRYASIRPPTGRTSCTSATHEPTAAAPSAGKWSPDAHGLGNGWHVWSSAETSCVASPAPAADSSGAMLPLPPPPPFFPPRAAAQHLPAAFASFSTSTA